MYAWFSDTAVQGTIMRSLPVLITILLISSFNAAAQSLPELRCPPGDARIACFANGQGAFYATPVGGDNANGFHGITRDKQKLFEQYHIQLGGTVLDRSTARCVVTPALLRREYPVHNTVEEILFTDSMTVLAVRVRTDWRGDVKIYPALAAWWRGANESLVGGDFFLGKGVQARLSVRGLQGSWENIRERDTQRFSNPSPVYMPTFYWGDGAETFTFTVAMIDDPRGRTAELPSFDTLLARKQRRIAQLLDEVNISSSDSVTVLATKWIAAAMDVLQLHGKHSGIWAGLPWFDDLWGRDTFIALPGALLATGRFDDARAVLRAFASRMDTVASSPSYGRIPNRVQPGDVIYNTVDGTPWMIVSLWQYLLHTGDSATIRELYPFVRHALRGALQRCDAHGLLKHADADTWMDAVGSQGPWSPRGNRAVEIQSLWLAQLRASIAMAGIAGDARNAEDWRRTALPHLRESILRHFISPATGALVDHLNSDGSQDTAVRPNALLALTIPGGLADLLSEKTRQATMQQAWSGCVLPHGVASLSVDDANFHPWHDAPRLYPKDAAYHNGTVWTWLSGPAIQLLCDHGQAEQAWRLLQSLQRYALHEAAAGGIPECTDALPRDNETTPRWSGTFTQAWSNAEYLRVLQQCFVGASPHPEHADVLRLHPLLSPTVNELSMHVHRASGSIAVSIVREKGTLRCSLASNAREVLRIAPGARTSADTSGWLILPPGGVLEVELPDRANEQQRHAELFPIARPRPARGYTVAAPPDWPMLTEATVTRRNPAAPQLCGAVDADGDDTGPNGRYSYPHSPLFVRGSFDLIGFDARSDDSLLYCTVRMRALSQPGWHPEYGFQLTMLAIAVDRTDAALQRTREIGQGSGYTITENNGYTHLILVGGGIRVLDARGEVLAGYVPETAHGAFGDVRSGEIRFALPLRLFGPNAAGWRFSIVAGAQDDHGGAGIGEFRAVRKEAGEWHGGGADGDDAPRWYDTMRCP